MQKGNIGVTTENIFPIIKKFLYSDHEIFLRELVSNAVDATRMVFVEGSKHSNDSDGNSILTSCLAPAASSTRA